MRGTRGPVTHLAAFVHHAAIGVVIAAARPLCLPVLATTTATAAFAASSSNDDEPIRTNRAVADVQIDLPLELNGAYLGDIPVTVRADGQVLVPASRLQDLIAERVGPSVRDRLTVLAGQAVSLDDLRAAGLDIDYDAEALKLSLTLAATDASLTSVRLGGATPPDPKAGPQPAELAIGLSVVGRLGYVHEDEFGPTGSDPARADLQGFVSVGGFDGWSLLWAADFEDDRDTPLRRGPILLVHDDYERALRYRIGDLRPRAEGFQVAPDLLGVGVERDFSAIQPFRNIQPSGRSQFTLERPARVTVEVNGDVVRTLDLAAGRYDVRDFAFAQGSNDVRILAEDEFGRRELAAFSTFADVDLLQRGISVFGLSAGVLREPFTLDGGLDYSEDVALLGHYSRGVTEAVTVGGQAEISERSSLIGANLAVGTRFGLVAGQLAVSDADQTALAALARYRLPPVDWRGLTHEIDAQVEHRAEGFASLGDLTPLTHDETRVDLRYLVRRGAYFASAAWSEVRALNRSRFISLTAGGRWRAWSFTASWRPETGDGRLERAERFLFTLSRRIGRTASFRARQATGPRETELEVQRYTARRVGEWGGRLAVADLADQGRLDGDLTLTGARGEIDLSHRTATYPRSTDVRRSSSELRLGVGFGYADGRLGFGRPFTDGFVLVSRHPTLERRPVTLTEGRRGPVAARADGLGPGLAPIRRAYQPETFVAEVEDLPVGYDLGAAQFTAFGPVRAGYLYEVGSDAANTVMATLLDANGQPVALVMGELRPLDAPTDEPAAFFTNRAGRLVAERVRPGRYALVLSDGRSGPEIFVAPDARGLVDLGPISLRSTP